MPQEEVPSGTAVCDRAQYPCDRGAGLREPEVPDQCVKWS